LIIFFIEKIEFILNFFGEVIFWLVETIDQL